MGVDSLSSSAQAMAHSASLDQRFALDVQGVDALRRTAQQAPQEALRQVSQQFEALFMNMVLKSMRDATPVSELFERRSEQFYQSMYDQQLSQSLSARGIGLADALLEQLSRNLAGGSAPEGTEAPFGAAAGVPQGRAAVPPQAQAVSAPAAAAVAVAPTPGQGSPQRAASAVTAEASGPVERFVTRMAAAAERASQASGVPASLILAQAALESGWGRREIRGDDGAPSFNLMGIKADRSWKGPVVETTTTEYVDGVAQRGRARFRAYGSYEEAFADYARFLTGNPRYRDVLATRDPEQAAHGLQRAGYATDPDYGGKLVRILRQLA